MSSIEARLGKLGLRSPPLVLPPGVVLPFAFVNVIGDRAIISGHGPQTDTGEVAEPFGVVGAELTVEDGYEAARKIGLSMLGSLKRELGSLDRITSWVKVLGMVRCSPDFGRQPAVINGFSDLILDVFGPEIGRHARSAVGMSSLPFGLPVEIEAEVIIQP